MVTEVRSLRVVAGMDESGYTAGAARKVAADKAMAASGKEVVFQFTETDQKVSQTGNVLARLSRQYVDGFASAQRFNAAINQLARGVELGKIEMTQATVILDGIYKKYGLMADAAQIAQRGQVDLARAVEQANNKLAAQQKITPTNQNSFINQRQQATSSFNTSNLAAQGFDIAATAAFMPWYTVALQQGPQVAQVFNQIRDSGASIGPAVAGAFAQILNPVSLVTIGVIGATAALVQYFTSAESASEKANNLLKEQNDIIRNAAKAWGDATPTLKAYVDQLDRVDQITRGKEAGELLAGRSLEGLSKDISGLNREFIVAMRSLNGIQADPTFIRDFRDAFGELRERLDDGTASVGDLNAAQRQLTTAVSNHGTEEVLAFRDAWEKVTESIFRGVEAARQAREEWLKAVAGGVTVQDILSGATFTENGRTYQSDAFRPRGATPVPDRRPLYELDRDPDPSTIMNSDGVTVPVPLPERKPSPLGGDPDRKAESEATRAANAYRDLIKTANDRVAQMRLEAEVSGQAGIAAQALRFELDLLQKAQDKGRDVTAQQREEIKQLAEAYRTAAEEAAKAKLQQDLMFEREQMFRSGTDQAIAVRLRGAGLPVDLQSQEAQMIRDNLRLQEAKSAVDSFFTDFKSALESNGGDIGEALGDALKNALINQLNRWADKAFEIVGNAITNALFGNGSADGSGGVAGSLASAVFSTGNSASYDAAAGVSRVFNPANSNVAGVGSAVDLAGSLLGSSEAADASQINSFLKQGGVDIDAARTAWCAAFVNSSLQQVGVDGSGSLLANSFQNWGSQIDASQVLRGDVLLKTNGLSALQTGGHVGFATGATRMFNGQSQLEMLSGNYQDKVSTAWFNAADLQVRRATDVSDALSNLSVSSLTATEGLGQFGSGLGSLGNNLASLFPAAPGGGVSGGGLGTWIGNLWGNLTNGAGSQWASAVSGSLLPGLFADGTQSAPGGLAIVGERGRELVNLPRGSQVVPNHKTEHLLATAANGNSAGSVKVDVEVYMRKDGTLDAFVRNVSREESASVAQQGLSEYRRNGIQDDIKRYNDDPYARGA